MNLFVGNLSPDTTSSDLLQLFSEFGYVLTAKVIIDRTTGRSKQFGFVSMADRFEAFDAIDNLDQIWFKGQIISVKKAKVNNQLNSESGAPKKVGNRRKQ